MFLSEVEVNVQNNVPSQPSPPALAASMPAACLLDDRANSAAIHRRDSLAADAATNLPM